MAASRGNIDIAATFGRNLKMARTAAGLTQHSLAVALGRGDAMTISRWERGEHRPTYENLVALADVLGRDIAWFYSDDDDPERTAA